MSVPDAKQRWLELLAAAVRDGTFVKLNLSRPCCADASLKNVLVRPVALRAGQRLSFVFRHITRDITKNLTSEEGLARIDTLLNGEFRAANLFTTRQSAQLELCDGQKPRLVLGQPRHASAPQTTHDRGRKRLIDVKQSPWLHALGVTTAEGKVRAGMEAKFRQINRFVEILRPLLGRTGRERAAGGTPAGSSAYVLSGVRPSSAAATSAGSSGSDCPNATGPPCVSAPEDGRTPPNTYSSAGKILSARSLTFVDMGCGKGYLTFAAYDLLRRAGWAELTVRGVEARPELVELCNRAARECGFSGLQFDTGTIESRSLDRVDVLVALHACDTATDDAIAKGVQAGAALILVAPCCHKELRPQLRPPPVLAETLKHGILRERQAEFVTDALRAALLEWAGYDTKVFEFISTEHTAKNLMIAAVKRRNPTRPDEEAARVRDLAAFYGIHSQRLADQLGIDLTKPRMNTNDHE